MDASNRGKKDGKQAYCHVVGVGLGVWMVDACQELLVLPKNSSVFVSLFYSVVYPYPAC